jgi:ubiquinone/menaquinone biosynthesis C-methylase UbiE
MDPIAYLLTFPAARKYAWRRFYPFFTGRMRGRDLVFLNYAFETAPPLGIELDAADEPNREWIQLYHHVASQEDLAGKEVLEVSCGHGGGASWITRTVKPARYTALDLNTEGIQFCEKRHQVPGLSFQQGDAQALPFGDASFDVVINVEASHCYPDFAGFLKEVARVLRPGGVFLYADLRFHYEYYQWIQDIEAAPLAVEGTRDITDEVSRGMRCNAARFEGLVRETMPWWLRRFMRGILGVPGYTLHAQMRTGRMTYRSWLMRRP